MFFFSRLTTRTRLYLMLLFPMMGLTYFSITSAISAFNTKEDAAYLGKTMNVSVVIAGTLIHELQKERGMSAGFIELRGSKFGPELAEQRKKRMQNWPIYLQCQRSVPGYAEKRVASPE